MNDLLPKQPLHVDKNVCGICESLKTETDWGLLMCPHCDTPCQNPYGGSCGVCRAGMKGLPERDDI